jgi:ATP-dependent DNA helicase RecG
MTTHEEFKGYLDAPEGTRLEFKEAKGTFQFDQLVKYCVALANEGGGKLLLGVTNTRPRRVVGTKAFAEPGQTEAGLFQRLSRRVAVEEYLDPTGRVVIVHVPARAPGTAWCDHGAYLMRAGDALVPMTDDQLRRIHSEADPDFSAEICMSATVDDLDPAAISAFRTRWAKKAENARLLTSTDEQTLTDAELMVSGGLTYSALILFGRGPALGRHLAQAEVVFEYRSSEASGPAQDRRDYRLGFFLLDDALWEQINLRNDRQSYQDGLFRFEIPTFDEQVIREAILNAVCHRDYRLPGSVFVLQYARRLEVVSPGGFPIGITEDNILDQQVPRNRRLAEACARCGLVERSGQGMNLMFERSISQSKPTPSFQGTSVHQVRLTLEGTVHSPAFVRFLERVGQERLRSFSTRDFLILDCLEHERPIPETLQHHLRRLVDTGVVEMIGRGRGTRYILSRQFYSFVGKKGVYTRKRGLDRETNKALLLRHIGDNRKVGCPLCELGEVLPALSRPQIQGLLHELKAEGQIHSVGHTKAGRWYPGSVTTEIASRIE